MLKKTIAILLIVVCVLALAVAGLSIWFNSPVRNTGEAVSLSIKKGETLDAIANELEGRSLIRSALFMRLYSKLTGTEQDFQQGTYTLRQGMSAVQIHDFLVSGKQVLIKVTIPEGYTLGQIAKLLDQKNIVSQKDFLSEARDPVLLHELGVAGGSVEGFLFPDTYLFTEGSPAEAVIRFMVGNFMDKITQIYPGWTALSPQQKLEKVVMASIVEREYVAPAEAPLIASVFYNRLAINKALESCATVVYVMTEQYNLPHPSRLFFRDLDRQSAYNTYLHRGLPPGPIASPGQISLNAAFYPSTSDYYYFVLKGPSATQHFFSKTFAEHNQASIFYLKGQS